MKTTGKPAVTHTEKLYTKTLVEKKKNHRPKPKAVSKKQFIAPVADNTTPVMVVSTDSVVQITNTQKKPLVAEVRKAKPALQVVDFTDSIKPQEWVAVTNSIKPKFRFTIGSLAKRGKKQKHFRLSIEAAHKFLKLIFYHMKHILWMCWVCIALPFSSVAENEDHLTFNDTLVIKLTGQTQVRIIGESMLKIIAYTRADSLKNIFINDLNAALSKSESKQLPVKVFYLVHPNGNRRLKMKQEEYVDETFELSREEYVMTENLPKHELNLFDLRTGIVIQFYVNDTSDLKEIADLNLLAAINFALANKNSSPV